MVIVLMGAAGAALHSSENIAKMGRGIPLTDEDRHPWLQALRKSIIEWIEQGTDAVLACSLLTKAHRAAVLTQYETHVKLVYLEAARPLLWERLSARTGHFAGVALLDSQLALLEKPAAALVLDASRTPEELVQTIRSTWRL